MSASADYPIRSRHYDDDRHKYRDARELDPRDLEPDYQDTGRSRRKGRYEDSGDEDLVPAYPKRDTKYVPLSRRRESPSPSPEPRQDTNVRRPRANSKVRLHVHRNDSGSDDEREDTYIRSRQRRGSKPEHAFMRPSKKAERSPSRDRSSIDLERKNSRRNREFRSQRDGLEFAEGEELKRARDAPRRRRSYDENDRGVNAAYIRTRADGDRRRRRDDPYDDDLPSRSQGKARVDVVEQPRRRDKYDDKYDGYDDRDRNRRRRAKMYDDYDEKPRRRRDDDYDETPSRRRDDDYDRCYRSDRGYKSEGTRRRRDDDYQSGRDPDRGRRDRYNDYDDRTRDRDRRDKARKKDVMDYIALAPKYYSDGQRYYKKAKDMGLVDQVVKMMGQNSR